MPRGGPHAGGGGSQGGAGGCRSIKSQAGAMSLTVARQQPWRPLAKRLAAPLWGVRQHMGQGPASSTRSRPSSRRWVLRLRPRRPPPIGTTCRDARPQVARRDPTRPQLTPSPADHGEATGARRHIARSRHSEGGVDRVQANLRHGGGCFRGTHVSQSQRRPQGQRCRSWGVTGALKDVRDRKNAHERTVDRAARPRACDRST